MTDDTTYDTIESYLLGQMPDAERTAFETRLTEDPVLAEQFAQQKREHLALQVLVEDRTRARLIDWNKQHPLRDSFLRRYRGLFGLIGLLLGLAALWLTFPLGQKKEPNKPKEFRESSPPPIAETPPSTPPVDTIVAPSPKPIPKAPVQRRALLALAAEFSEPVRFPDANLRNDNTSPDTLESALLDLRQRRFAKGLRRLRTIPAGHPQYLDAQYYQGLAHYEREAFGKAIPFLRTVANTPDYLYAEQAEWRLVLAYLQNSQLKSSKERARKIAADTGHAFQEKAQKLLKRLSSIEGG